jgi:hypothetical protein
MNINTARIKSSQEVAELPPVKRALERERVVLGYR